MLKKHKNSGFTLIEILIVIIIIGVIVASASLSLSNRKDTGASTTTVLNLLRNRMVYAQQQAILLNKTLGLGLSTEGYEFMEYNQGGTNSGWQVITERGLDQHDWPGNFSLQLAIGKELPGSLSSHFPDQPQIIFSPSGKITLFQFYINDNYILASNEANEITITKK